MHIFWADLAAGKDKCFMDLNIVNQLINMVKASGLSAVELEENGFRVRLENDNVGLSAPISVPTATAETAFAPAPPQPVSIPAAPVPAAAEDKAEEDCLYVTCPMVGVFCSLEKLGKKALQPGDKIESGQAVCAVEAMKMVCDVESEVSGVYVETLVKDGDQVEYGQPLLKLKKA